MSVARELPRPRWALHCAQLLLPAREGPDETANQNQRGKCDEYTTKVQNHEASSSASSSLPVQLSTCLSGSQKYSE
eukprot:scaffold676_cov115-Isochrysis_galbana.AAC.11